MFGELKPVRLAVVTPIPTPYRDPFWNEVAAQPNVHSLDVYYCAKGKPDRPWQIDWPQNFDAHYLPSVNLMRFGAADKSAFWVRGLNKAMREANHDAVLIGGYNHPAMLSAIRGCKKRGQPYFLMCETHRQTKTWKSIVKDRLVRKICEGAAGGLPTGKLAGQYLESYGIPPERMTRLPNVPDVQRLQQLATELKLDVTERRASLGIPATSPTLIFVGRLIPKKRPMLVLKAFASKAPADARLILLGDGPLMQECRNLVTSLGLDDRVIFKGFCQPEEVPGYLSLADAFVLPSSETWGVAVIEAAAMGIPVIVADEVGCHPDVVVNESCGSVVKSGSLDALAGAIHVHLTRHQTSEFPVERFSYPSLAQELTSTIQRHLQSTGGCFEVGCS